MSQRKVAAIRRLYEQTSRATVEHDLRAAIEILKTFPDEESRARAAVYMDGLSLLRSEWRLEKRKADQQKEAPKSSARPGRPRAKRSKKPKRMRRR